MGGDSSWHRVRRQPGISARSWARRVATAGFWFLLLCSGCRSIYEKTLPAVGASPEKRFQLRLEEARQMQEWVDRAAGRVERRLHEGEPVLEWRAEMDRLQVATMDLGRALAAAEEAFPAGPLSHAELQELQRLHERLDQVRQLLAQVCPPPPPEPGAPQRERSADTGGCRAGQGIGAKKQP